ncbi:Ctr copper transporter [Ceraceosorus guamensis]|uniref:Copper transport protein n=1 Tax=Ceraceosorus guamensis TaxID=1522189 RepID=A0A316VUP9_9BASI|nr:Ctr copper transporter [Ceraceosorus guamensis]PWN39991.1 Ctr copper transporter [Ceraceosorus guamensis]
MLWNWYTVDACFLSSSWRITNGGSMAATCIGVAFLVVLLEFTRRLGKEYDLLIRRQWAVRASQLSRINSSSTSTSTEDAAAAGPITIKFRATPLQQLIRSLLHATTFAAAYIVMLLAMYFNGFIILSIILGAGLGKLLCDWETLEITLDLDHHHAGSSSSSAKEHSRVTATTCEDPTVCCG